MVGVAAVVLVMLAGTFAFVYHSTGSQLKAQIDRTIRGDAIQMRNAILLRKPASPKAALKEARRSTASEPYRNSAVLLFALFPGVGRASNHTELFGAARPDADETVGRAAAGERGGQAPGEAARRLQHKTGA